MSLWRTLTAGARRRRQLRALGAEFVPNGRDEYLFVDGDKRLPIYAERQARGDVDVVVWEADAVGDWLPPHAHQSLSDARRRQILALFLRYLAIFDLRVEVLRGDRPPGDRDAAGAG